MVAFVSELGGEVVLEPPPPLQPIAPAKTTTDKRASIGNQRRRRDGMPSIRTVANAAASLPNFHRFHLNGRTSALVAAAVVFTVKTVVPLPPDVTVTLAGFKLQTGRFCAPAGDPVRVQVMFMVPEYVLPAERVAVAVVWAPGETGDGAGTAMITWDICTTDASEVTEV